MPREIVSHTQRSVVANTAALDPRSRALLELQRQSLARTLSDDQPEPSVGDVWVTHVTWHDGIAKGLAAMIVVLRAFTEAWSPRTLYDVAPLSDDEQLASEWSLLLGADVSGLGFPIVAHVDAQCTTTSSMLSRRLGALAEAALADLHRLLQAYAIGDTAALEFAVARAGRRSIRHHLVWEEFAEALLAISQALAAPLLDSADGTPEEDLVVESGPSLAFVREKSPPPIVERWVVDWNPPRLRECAPGNSEVVLMGHVIALYLRDYPAKAPQHESLQLLSVVFDLHYDEIAALPHLKRLTRLRQCYEKGAPGTDVFAFISDSLRYWHTLHMRETAGPTLDRLAARKTDPRKS